jgi:hypothetical protein
MRGPAIQQYFQAVGRFKRDAIALIHMCGGGPWRGMEIITVQHRNSATADGRGVFISDGMVQTVTGYHKEYGLRSFIDSCPGRWGNCWCIIGGWSSLWWIICRCFGTAFCSLKLLSESLDLIRIVTRHCPASYDAKGNKKTS